MFHLSACMLRKSVTAFHGGSWRKRSDRSNSMADIPFNTLAVAKRLEAKGFSTEKAEAVTDALHTGITGGVATKADIAEVRSDIVEVKTELKWMKLIGGGFILAVFPLWLAEMIALVTNGG